MKGHFSGMRPLVFVLGLMDISTRYPCIRFLNSNLTVMSLYHATRQVCPLSENSQGDCVTSSGEGTVSAHNRESISYKSKLSNNER